MRGRARVLPPTEHSKPGDPLFTQVPTDAVRQMESEIVRLRARLAAIAAHKPSHPIIPMTMGKDHVCAVCFRFVYENGDYRGGRFRHEDDEERRR